MTFFIGARTRESLYDTNIFLEILLGQQKADTALKAIETISERKRGCVTSFSVHAIEAILRGTRRFELILDFLDFVETHPYLDRYSTSSQEEREIAEAAGQLNLDYEDSLQFYVARTRGLTLVTFDLHFRKLKGAKILFP